VGHLSNTALPSWLLGHEMLRQNDQTRLHTSLQHIFNAIIARTVPRISPLLVPSLQGNGASSLSLEPHASVDTISTLCSLSPSASSYGDLEYYPPSLQQGSAYKFGNTHVLHTAPTSALSHKIHLRSSQSCWPVLPRIYCSIQRNIHLSTTHRPLTPFT
jgi:hypothetical protein